MSEARRHDLRLARWSGGASALASLVVAASTLCCLPLAAAAAAGLASLGGGLVWSLRPWLVGFAGASLVFGFWRAYRPCPPGEPCANAASRPLTRVLLWVSAALTVVLASLPWWAPRLLIALG